MQSCRTVPEADARQQQSPVIACRKTILLDAELCWNSQESTGYVCAYSRSPTECRFIPCAEQKASTCLTLIVYSVSRKTPWTPFFFWAEHASRCQAYVARCGETCLHSLKLLLNALLQGPYLTPCAQNAFLMLL